jgi:hypothetical protein
VPPSPLQNRVLPTGEIVAHPARGLMMGNRGCIHAPDRTLGVTRWRSKLWICCVLQWKNVRRDVMPPGRWTALFFMDEATALAAGHRPCAYCRRPDYTWFTQSWQKAQDLPERPRAVFMDQILHAERVTRTRQQITRPARAGSLPDGVMVRHNGTVGLLASGRFLPWSFDGYGAPQRIQPTTSVELLTPPSIVAALESGYRPMVHPSATSSGLRVH